MCLHPSLWFMKTPQLGHPRNDGHLEPLQSFAWAVHVIPWSAHVIISIGTGRKLLVHCHLTSMCRVTSWTSPCFQLPPPPNHSTVWTGSANQTEALLGKSMQSTEWPPSLLPPSRTLAVSILVAAALADPAPVAASPGELEARFTLSLFLQKLTLRGCSRRANAVFRMASDPKTTPGGRSRQANAVFRAASPPEKQSIFVSGLRPTAIILDAVGLFHKLQFHLLPFWLMNISPTSTTCRSVSHPPRTVAVFPDELSGLHAMNS